MMFVKLYFRTSYIYLISLVSLIGSIRLSFANEMDVMHRKGTNIHVRHVLHWSSSISALLEHPFWGCLSGSVSTQLLQKGKASLNTGQTQIWRSFAKGRSTVLYYKWSTFTVQNRL